MKVEYNARITDHITIYAAELTAIKMALNWIEQQHHTEFATKKVTICSDSLSSLQSFKSGKSSNRPNLFTEVLEILNNVVNDITLI